VRVGLIARAEDRGLGVQTWEWSRAMRPDATLIVDMGQLGGGFPMHLGRYSSDATVAAFDGIKFRDEQQVRTWLEQIDVAYTAETFYDTRLPGWCDEHGVRLSVHINPEFWKWQRESQAWPAMRWWAPTAWRLEHLPATAAVVPVPVPLDRWPAPAPLREQPVFVHVVGHRAAADRNGTSLLLAAVQRLAVPFRLRLITQGDRLPVPAVAPMVDVEVHTGGVEDYWRMYDDADVLVLPRRYGGLCLPANEAAGAGLALVMTDCSPNTRWPIVGVHSHTTSTMDTPGGSMPLAGADVAHLVQILSGLALDHEQRHEAQRRARRWAELMSWEQQRQRICEVMACA
jgi:glycosyltransferase involved in cell wall biosynthesis